VGLTVSTFVLDTNIILYFLGGRLEDALPDGQYAVSVISELELLAYPGLTTPESERVKAFLADIAIVELTPLVKPMRWRSGNDSASNSRMPLSPPPLRRWMPLS